MKLSRKAAIAVVAAAILLIAAACISAFTYAYYLAGITVYTNDNEKQYAKIGMNLSLLFDRLNPEKVADNADLKIFAGRDTDGNETYYTYDSEAKWGTAQNPYIISDIRHLQNLSALWGIGYFDEYTEQFDVNNPKPEEAYKAIPYFLICNPDGTPVTINGSGANIKPIGEDGKPFIGYVGGAFKEGSTEIKGKISDVSAIYNLNVTTTDDKVDVGLFGAVGYLGDSSAAVTLQEILEKENITDISDISDARLEELKNKYGNTFGSFIGINSTLRDLLLYDVTVTVKDPTWLDTLSALVAGHSVSQTDCENHHLGILAGHVEYTTVEFISVYYSDETVKAFDISHTKAYKSGDYANYYSESGIIGKMFMMNPYINDGYISAPDDSGDGTSTGDDGTGGGALTGMGRGYVSAKGVFDSYHNSGLLVTYQIQGEGDAVIEYIGPLVIKNGTTYTLNDGVTPVTVKESTGSDALNTGKDGSASFTDTYQNFFGQNRQDTVAWDDFIVKDGDHYYHRGNVNAEVDASKINMNSGIIIRYGMDEDGNHLCTEWVRQRILIGTQNSGSYYFTDGVFTFALSSKMDTIEETWKDGEADEFYIGANNNSEWKADISKGNKGVVAYLRPITNNIELAAADGEALCVMYKNPDNSGNVSLLTLNNTSTLSGNAYTTQNAASFTLAQSDFVQSLITGYSTGELKIDGAKEGKSDNQITISAADIANNLQRGLNGENDGWLAINIGTSETSLTELRNTYKVTTTKTENNYYIFASNVLSDSIDYSGLEVDAANRSYNVMTIDSGEVSWGAGYFYVSTSRQYVITGNYISRLYYRSYSGDTATEIGSINTGNQKPTRANIENLITSELEFYDLQYGETIYQDRENTSRKGLLLVTEDNNWYLFDVGTKVTLSTSDIVPASENTYEYVKSTYYIDNFIYRIRQNDGTYNYYYSDNTQLQGTPTPTGNVIYNESTNTYYQEFSATKVGGTTVTGAYLERLSYFKLNNFAKTNHLYYLYRGVGDCAVTYYYDLYCGPNGNVSNLIGSAQDECSVSFAADGSGSCTIHYSNDGTPIGRYLAYNSGSFTGSISKGELYIFVLEATQEVEYGRIGFMPADNSATNSGALSADEYVLWPDYSESYYTATTDATSTADPTYYVVSLDQLPYLEYAYYDKEGEFTNGWQNGIDSTILGANDISKLFKMKEGASFGTTINLFNGQLSSDGFITAPVGSMGINANIPQGCIAFRVNKESETGHYIRVIVSVPCTTLYRGEAGYDINWNADYYVGLWQMEAGGESTVQRFEANDAIYKFELPRSNGYEPGTTTSDTNSNYANVYYNMSGTDSSDANGQRAGDGIPDIPDTTTTYRTYLNGSRVLVAYAFKVQEAGVYVIGAVNSNENTAFPLEIAFFSADATASAGHDGIQGSELGSIDFVYDGTDATTGESKIITVKESSGDGGITNYSHYYYSSLCKLYIDNSAGVNVNDFNAFVRRQHNPDNLGATLGLNSGGSSSGYLYLKPYGGAESDDVLVNGTAPTS